GTAVAQVESFVKAVQDWTARFAHATSYAPDRLLPPCADHPVGRRGLARPRARRHAASPTTDGRGRERRRPRIPTTARRTRGSCTACSACPRHAGHPFAVPIEWAAAAWVVHDPGGTYRPGGAVTRGALAALLHRSTTRLPGRRERRE